MKTTKTLILRRIAAAVSALSACTAFAFTAFADEAAAASNTSDGQQQVSFDPANPSKKEALPFPKSNVLQFFLEGGTIVSARPSGTEPKIKFYINSVVPVNGASDEAFENAKKDSAALCDRISAEITAILDAAC